eukprot:gb/GECH01005813.1/.p1 GENE.gb/GECH01005813.1/~~gb/GECH01005813.1/.p1  ORF type:complete len:403 (+),score=79.29 gb/GECH01005813.1/:1-1209(+)
MPEKTSQPTSQSPSQDDLQKQQQQQFFTSLTQEEKTDLFWRLYRAKNHDCTDAVYSLSAALTNKSTVPLNVANEVYIGCILSSVFPQRNDCLPSQSFMLSVARGENRFSASERKDLEDCLARDDALAQLTSLGNLGWFAVSNEDVMGKYLAQTKRQVYNPSTAILDESSLIDISRKYKEQQKNCREEIEHLHECQQSEMQNVINEGRVLFNDENEVLRETAERCHKHISRAEVCFNSALCAFPLWRCMSTRSGSTDPFYNRQQYPGCFQDAQVRVCIDAVQENHDAEEKAITKTMETSCKEPYRDLRRCLRFMDRGDVESCHESLGKFMNCAMISFCAREFESCRKAPSLDQCRDKDQLEACASRFKEIFPRTPAMQRVLPDNVILVEEDENDYDNNGVMEN